MGRQRNLQKDPETACEREQREPTPHSSVELSCQWRQDTVVLEKENRDRSADRASANVKERKAPVISKLRG